MLKAGERPAFAVRHASHYETRHPDGCLSQRMEHFVDSIYGFGTVEDAFVRS